MHRQLDKYLTKGWIKLSVSPYGAPVLFVHKKGGTLCMCINFRMLNKLKKIDAYPTPQIDEILDHLYKALVFSKIYLSKAYHQVAVEQSYMHKTTFLTKYRLFKSLVLPFRLVNTPATF